MPFPNLYRCNKVLVNQKKIVITDIVITAIASFAARLHIVYVVNDVLHACLKRRGEASAAVDPVR
jgi:hypothetical protein